MVRKLEENSDLTTDDKDALLGLAWKEKSYQPGSFLVREGSVATHCNVLLDGFCYAQKIAIEGERQILGFYVQGDLVHLQAPFLSISDHNIQFLTRSRVAEIAVEDMSELFKSNPNVARACWVASLLEASILRQWLTNVGRKQAKQRLAHLFCEFAVRLKTVGLGDEQSYVMPLTQEQLGDATGLSPVHVSRSLKGLVSEGLIERDGRSVKISNWENLCREADFNDRYLHLAHAP